MRVVYHNWSATKQRPHPQSVAEISDSDDDVCRRRVNVLLICSQDEVELCSATAQFESFVLQFFDR